MNVGQFTIGVRGWQETVSNKKPIYTEEMALLTARIKAARLSAGLTQGELALRLGKKSHTAILKLEQGQVRIELLELRRICQICGIPFREFIDKIEGDLERQDKLRNALDTPDD